MWSSKRQKPTPLPSKKKKPSLLRFDFFRLLNLTFSDSKSLSWDCPSVSPLSPLLVHSSWVVPKSMPPSTTHALCSLAPHPGLSTSKYLVRKQFRRWDLKTLDGYWVINTFVNLLNFILNLIFILYYLIYNVVLVSGL